MTRLRVFFALPFLILFLPLWRFLDILAFTWPHNIVFGAIFGFLLLVCIALPVRMVRQKTHWAILVVVPILMGILAGYLGPLSKMSTADSEFNHCGNLSYTGIFYPMRKLMTAAHQDDLEIRNQLCWVRKMVIRVLPKFSSETEYVTYTKITRDKLLKPPLKYKVTLPLIGFLYGNIINRWDNYNIPLMRNIQAGKLFLDEMGFWTREYTEEVSAREYGWWDYLHGNYIKWEYGLVEDNWQSLLDGIWVK